MKRTLGIILVCIALTLAFAACGNEKAPVTSNPTEAPVTTAQPVTSAPVTTQGHQHTITIIPGEEATCFSEGITEGQKCKECDEVLVAQEPIPTLPHKFEAYTVSSLGIHYSICENCGDVLDAEEHEAGCEICGLDGYVLGGDNGQEGILVINKDGTFTIGQDCYYLKKIDGESAQGTYTIVVDIPEGYTKPRETGLFFCRQEVGTLPYNTTAEESLNGGPYYYVNMSQNTAAAVNGLIPAGADNPWNNTSQGNLNTPTGSTAAMTAGTRHTFVCEYSIDPDTKVGTMVVTTSNGAETQTRTITTKPGAFNGLYWGIRNRSDADLTIVEMSFAAK